MSAPFWNRSASSDERRLITTETRHLSQDFVRYVIWERSEWLMQNRLTHPEAAFPQLMEDIVIIDGYPPMSITRDWQDEHSIVSFRSIHSTVCDGAMAQE